LYNFIFEAVWVVAQRSGRRAQGKNEIYINQSTGANGAELRAQSTGEERDLYKSEHGMVLFFVKTWSCSLAVFWSIIYL